MVTTEGMADGNASFLRAARSGNLEKVIEFLKGNIDINTSNANGLNALHLAAKEGHVNVVTELLKRGANVNAATKKGNTALHIASLAGQEEVVKVLIQLGANVNVQSQNGFTPLYMAAQENHDAVVSFLLASGANQSLATEDGFTPLAVALQQGHDKVVAVLLENDTKGKVRLPALHIAAKKDDCKAATLLLQSDHNPDVTSKSGFTPLHIAAHYGNENIAKILLNKGADVNYAAKHQITPLHVASKWGKLNMVVLLLEKGANIDAATRDGLTPLHCAARSGHDLVVDLLLEKGAPFLAKTKNGLAPLHMASQGDHVDSARILLFHKAPVDDVTVDYLTALHVAAHCGHVKVAKLLLDRKADANARALNGFTPLHIACKKNRIKVVELLLKHGASIEATTESGLTPLHVASFMGCMNIVIYLIQNGANPDVPTVRGETPLHLAARANQTDIIRILLRNGASVDARAREEQTPLHIAARLGNVDIVSLLLQHGAAVDAVTKDMYTALHITAKEDQEEVAAALLDHGASLTATTKKGFTPLHLAAKYGNIKVARLLLQKGAPVDAQGKNGVTPLHVAAHYDHVNVALLLLDKGASPHAMAKNGYTPLHIAAKKNQMDIASTLLEYGANTNSESKAGFTPLHLASQEGHADMSSLLIENKANVNQKANNGLTPLHLCAQDDRVNVAQVLVKNGAEICPQTKAGYTPLHVASHFGQINMVRFLLQNDANVHTVTSHGYTPLHQAAQQGHTLVVNLLLESQASPNVTTVQGQTPLSIAQRLGYISVVETLKVVTETTVTTTTTTVTEEKYKVVAPETMQETFMTDSEDEGGEEAMLGDQSYRYLTADEMKSLGDDSLPIDVTKDEKQQDAMQAVKQFGAPMVEEDNLSPQHATPVESGFSEKFSPDNVDLAKVPVHAGRFSWDDAYFYYSPKGMLRSRFLVSFMVDARGGAMRGCRHSGVRVIIPPRKASMPMRITCRYLRKEKLIHPPPLMEGEACASRILEMGPVGARFLGPVIIEVPHFASTRGKEREITILRSDTGESWREHTLEASEEAVQEVLNESFEGEELSALEDLNTNRITRILTTDFPQYFAIVTRIRQEVHGVGPEGGMVSSTVVPQVQAIFPEGALTKKIRVGLQAQPIAPELVVKLLGNRVAVSPIVTVEPRRRKFHKPITLTIPVPQAATKGMINQYNKDAPTLRLLCSITGSTKSGGSSKAQWEDVTGSTPFTFVNDCVSFTTTVSARFWLMDCRQVNEVTRFATELYQEAVYVPFMSKFVIFAKRHDPFEAELRVFCMTDDKEDKTLETQEHFTEVAKSRDVEVLEGKLQYLEFAGNLVPVTKSGEQLKLTFQAFHENRLPFTIRVKDPHVEAMGRIAFMKEPKAARGEPPQTPICNLNVALPEVTMTEANADVLELVKLEKSYDFMQEAGLSKPELIHRADLRLSDIARELDKDWVLLAQQLDIPEQDVEHIKAQTVCDQSEQARMMLRLWLQKSGSKATGNELEKGLRKINREDIINNCMFNVELVTDDVEKAVAKVHLDQSGFDVFKEELGSSREASMRRGASLDVSYTDEQDIMKEAESAAETSSETGSLFERDQLSQALTDDKDECAILSVHETVLSVTDSPINSNKLDSGEINGTTQTTSELKDENSSKHGTDFNYFSGVSNKITDDHMQRDQLLLSQNGSKLHEFWPPGMIIQTPSGADSLPSNLSLDVTSDKNLLNSSDKIENNAKENEKNDLNISNESSDKVPNIILKSDSIEQTKELNKTSFESSEPVILEQILDFRTTIFSDVTTQSTKSSNGVSSRQDEILPSSNGKYSPQISEESEYIAVLEPDVEFPEESSSNMTDNEPKESLLKGMLIEDITSSNGLGELQNFRKVVEPTTEISYSTSTTGSKRLFTDADRNLFPIQEVEKDDSDAFTVPDAFSFETSITESLNSYNVMRSKLNNLDMDLKGELDDKFHNGFKSDLPVEASDLGYFSLDKESNLSSIPMVSEKNKGVDPSTALSVEENENILNESISLNLLPDWQTCANSEKIVNMENPKHCDLRDLNVSDMMEFDYLNESENFQKEAFKLSEDGPIMQKPAFEDISSELTSKNYDPLNQEKAEIVKSGDYSCLEGGIEIEKLKEISALLPEIKDSEDRKPIETEFKTVEITSKVGENVILTTVVQEIPAKLTESETWPSGDLDTSQVSVSSLPDDEKTEPTTATVSSTAAITVDITKRTVPDTEITEVDKSGTTTHIIQKTTHMTLITHMKSDDTIEGDLQGVIPVDSMMDQESSPHSPELSFAEKRDFFQKLSLSSSSPSVTPTHTSKTNIETEIKLLPVTDNVINIEGSPEEQLSFVERVKFFETSSEIHTIQTVQTIMPEIKEIKKEVWTVSENELSEPKSSVYTDDVLEKEREIETIEVLEETSRISTDEREEVSSPLYTGKEVLETIFDTNKDAKVEVMVKKLSPGSEMIEICSVENISKLEIENLVEAIDASDKTKSRQLMEKDVAKETIESAVDVSSEKVLADTDKSETDEEFITKTFRSVTETSFEVSKSTIDAFKKGVNDKLENKWQRESPDNISIVKETMEPSLGKSEIFICTEETLDNVKKILSVADAESNVIVSGSEPLVAEEPQVEEIAKEVQSIVLEHAKSEGIIEIGEKQVDETVAEEAPLEHSEMKPDSLTVLPEIASTVVSKSENICESVETKHISLTSGIGTFVDISSPEKTFIDKIETTDVSFSKQSEIEEIHEEIPSYSGSNGEKSDSGASSVKDRSIEIEFLPVLVVSDDVKVSVDKTGHEALGTPCSFHKEMSIESQHSELEQSFENRQSDSSSGKKIPLTSFAAVEKAEYEEVEKEKKEDIKDIIYRESVTYEQRGKELVQSVEVTQFTEHSTEVFNVSSEKLREKFSSKKIHIDTSTEEKDSKGSVPKKLNQFLDSVTQLSDLALPSDVAPVHKRTEEWLDQSGDLMLKEGAIIESVDNGLYEDRPPTLDDEQHRRSSPTAESFDDKARVEQCDTDVMMQLLDFVSRNDIEMAEVRTEDEAPDIEEDVSPSGEEEICSRLTYEDGKIEEKIPEAEEKTDDYLKVAESENLLHSPLRSSFDSVTSPSKRDLSLDNVETVVETKQSIEDGLKHIGASQQIHPQSSLEVEVGSLNSDELGYNDNEKEIVPLSFVEEEDSAKPELFPSTEEKIRNVEDVHQYTKEIAVTSIVIDSSSKLVSGVTEGLKELTSIEEKEPVHTETATKSLDSPMSDLDVPLQEPVEHVQQMPSETLVSETDMADKEELVKTKDVYLSEKEIHTVTDTQYIEKSDSAFVPCAFVNTAFAGAEVIDEVEQASPIRARSPYEVIRGEADSKVFDFPPEEERDTSGGVERVNFITRRVEIRHRPILQHIPSEISEEDLVEREITSPVGKEELESFDMPVSVETKIYEAEPTVKVVKTVTTTRVTRSSGDFHDGASQIAEPPEDSEVVIPSEMKQEIETFDIPTRVESLVSEDESSGIKVIKTITTTRVVRSGDYDDAEQIPDPQMIQGDEASQGAIEELESVEIPSDVEKIVSEDEQSGIRVVKTITTTRVLRSSGDYDENVDQIAESQEQFITQMSSDLKDEMESFDIPAKVETMSEDALSGIKVVKTVTTTKIIGDSGDYDDKIGETSETKDLLESKISPFTKEEMKSFDAPTSIETKVLEDDSSGIKVVKTITTTRVIRSSENYDDSTDLSTEFQEMLDSKMPPDEIKIKSETSEYAAKTDDITTPESDTGIPTSPFELISECELSDGDHKSSTFPLSQSYLRSEKEEKSHDSVITTTHSQSVTEKTVSVSIASTKDYSDCSTLNEMIDQSESKAMSQGMTPTTAGAIESKPLTNGPGEVEYHAEYDYDDETDKKYAFENISYSGGSAGEPSEIGEAKKCHYSSISDDVIDSEIRDILDSDQPLEDIIERPVTPEPPKDDGVGLGFISRNLKRPSEEAIEGLISDTGFAYSDDAAALSPTSPDSKSGFAYGMQFEKYVLDQAEEAMDVDSDQYSEEKEPSYNYGMRFERDPDLEDEDIPCYGDLYTHEEEDEDAIENGEKVKVVQKPVKDSDFDILAGRKYFTKNIEIDELSMSSLQEFERLEAEIVSGRKSSIGSVDSLNGKQAISKSGEHDDVSMSSLTEFERIEKECTEGEKVDPSMQESITQLSEIEEGHESQASEASQENKEDGKEEDVSIIEDYNDELENIEEIILKAENEKTDELPFQFMMKQTQKIEQIADGIELTYKDDRLTDSKIVDPSKQKGIKTTVVTEVTKVSSWTTSKSLESSLADTKDDLDQDSLRDEVSLKPDSLIDDGRQDFQDSLHEERFDDADSLQEENLDEMRDSLFEERHIEDDSLHEMDIMPDESSLSLESSLPAVPSLDSSKADDVVKVKVTDLKEPTDTQQEIVGTTIETFHLEGKTQINIADLQRGVDVMQSSTDSLEQSSSGALAAFHVESESLMSSSLNSAITSEDYTMISSTDTLEQDGRITYRYEDIPVDDIEMLVRGGQRVIVDSEGNFQAHYDGKHFIETDEITNACLTKDITEVKLPPTSSVQVHSALTTVKYVNGDQEQQKSNIFHSTSDKGEDYTSFESSHFDPDVEVEEIETTDEFGNTKIIRKIKKVTRTKAQFSSSSSSKDVEEKLKEFLREHAAGEDAGTAKEEVEEERKVDDKGNVVVIRTVKQQVLTDPEVHSKKFTGPNAAQQSQEYVETFQSLDPTEDVSEYEKVDEQGNVIRVTQKFVVTPQVHTVSFSGPDAHKQMEEYMKQWTLQSQNVGEFEGDQQRTIFPALQMSRSSELSEASIPTDTSENLVQKVIGDTVVTKTVLSTSSEKLVKPESSTITSISLETEKVKPSDSIEDKTSAMPK